MINDYDNGYWLQRSRNWSRKPPRSKEASPSHAYVVENLSGEGHSVLVSGCGFGWHLHHLSEFKSVYAIDYVPEFVEKSTAVAPPNCVVTLDDLRDLEFDTQVDICVTSISLQHLGVMEAILAGARTLAKLGHDLVFWESEKMPTGETVPWEETLKELGFSMEFFELHPNGRTALMHFSDGQGVYVRSP